MRSATQRSLQGSSRLSALNTIQPSYGFRRRPVGAGDKMSIRTEGLRSEATATFVAWEAPSSWQFRLSFIMQSTVNDVGIRTEERSR